MKAVITRDPKNFRNIRRNWNPVQLAVEKWRPGEKFAVMFEGQHQRKRGELPPDIRPTIITVLGRYLLGGIRAEDENGQTFIIREGQSRTHIIETEH